MKAVVLAGGEGARLAPYTRILPKPLLPVGDRPILEIILAQLRDAGIEEVVLATGYLSSLIETYFGDGTAFGIPISYVREDRPLGTAGPLSRIDGLDDTFLLMNGDILAEPFYGELIRAHQADGAAATIATRTEDVSLDYGVVRLGEQEGPLRRVTGIEEKPHYVIDVSLGVYAFEPAVLDHLEPGRHMDFPDLIARLVGAGERVAAYRHDGYWLDLGTVHRLEAGLQDYEVRAEEWVGRSRMDPRTAARQDGPQPPLDLQEQDSAK
jgi:NDP-mannose synthase